MDVETPRRRFLELAGTGTALSLAGCNALQNAQSNGGGGNGSPTVAVQVGPDQQRQSEIESALQNGNISRREAQQRYQESLANATDAFESRTSEDDSLTVDDSISEFGLFLVEGEPASLIEALSYEEVIALLPESSFQQALAQSGQRNGTANRTGE